MPTRPVAAATLPPHDCARTAGGEQVRRTAANFATIEHIAANLMRAKADKHLIVLRHDFLCHF